MTHPDIVQSTLGDEGVAARVDLGDDALFVTPTRTILYRADKLLSDESVEEFPHGAERLTVSTGRRKATLTLDYGLDGERSFTVPTKALDRALHPVLAGTLNAVGVTDAGETVKETFRFSELTLVVTSDRLVKHIGNAVWDGEFEEFHYDDVTDLSFEEGSVATTLVVSLGGRQERFKAPNERAREVRERLTEAVLDYHDVDSVATLRERFAPDEDETPSATMSFGEGPTPLSVDSGASSDTGESGDTGEPGDTGESGDTGATGAAGAGHSRERATPDTERTEPARASDAERSPTDESETAADARGNTAGEPIETTDTTETAETAGTESGSRSDGTAGLDTIGSANLLDPVDDGDDTDDTRRPTTDDAEGGTDTAGNERRGDAELASLVAEVEALRESVEAQNERIARQEEVIERLIVELRSRL